MLHHRFYYGRDHFDRAKQFRVLSNSKRASSEIRLNIRLATKSSQSPVSKTQLSALKNITELQNDTCEAGQLQLNKKKVFVLDRVRRNIDFTERSPPTQQRASPLKQGDALKNIPVKKIIAKLQSITDEKKFMEHLQSRDNLATVKLQPFMQNSGQKELKLGSAERSLLQPKPSQSEISIDKHRLKSQQSLRSEFKDYKISLEQRQFTYKIVLAYHFALQVAAKEAEVEEFLGQSTRDIAYMRIKQNLINLPLNIKGLETLSRNYRNFYKCVRPHIPQMLEEYVFHEGEVFKPITLESQLFYIFINQSNLFEQVNNAPVRFASKPSAESLKAIFEIENQLMSGKGDCQQTLEQLVHQSFEEMLLQAKSFYSLQLNFEFVKALYCFCCKVSELLSNKIWQESQRRIPYQRTVDFEQEVKKLKNIQKGQVELEMFKQMKPFQSDLTSQLDEYEHKHGRLEIVTNLQRQLARLADLKQSSQQKRS